MKKYSIGLFALFLLCMVLIGAAYQFSFEYSRNQAREEARMQEENREAARAEVVAAEGNVSKEEIFYLMELNGFVAVYRADKETIYEYTNIVVEDLPGEIRQEIMEGKEIRTIEKLYGFLESYSS